MRRLKKLSKRPWTSGLLAGCLAAVALLATASAASAVTYRPTRTDDPAPNGCKKKNCSLREAVIASNASGTPATILLRPGKRYVLTRKGAGENAALTGDLDITSGPLVVKTEGGGKTDPATIDANGIDRIFDGSLTLNGVTLRDGHARVVAGDTGVGGAIRGGILDIRNSRLVNNTADFHPSNLLADGNGGAIFVKSGGESTSTGRGSRATRPPARGEQSLSRRAGAHPSSSRRSPATNPGGPGEAGWPSTRVRAQKSTARPSPATKRQPISVPVAASASSAPPEGPTATLEIQNSTVADNSAGKDGGGIGSEDIDRLREPRDRGARLRHDRSQPGEHRAR